MKKLTIKVTCAAVAAVMGMTALAGCQKTESLDGTQTAMTVDGIEIPAGVLSFAVRYQQAQTEYYYSMMMSSSYGPDAKMSVWDEEGEDGKTYGEQTRDEITETLGKMYLVRDKAEEYKLELTKEEQSAIDKAADSFIKGNDAATLEKIGVAKEDVAEYLELNTYYSKAQKPVIADETIEVTDKEAAQSTITYASFSTADLEDDAKAKKKKDAEKLLAEVKASEDPAKADMKAMAEAIDESVIATDFSFGEDDTTLDDALKAEAKKLKDGQVCDKVIEGETNYFVVRMDQTLDQEATKEKKESLLKEKEREAFDDIVQSWYDGAKIKQEKKVMKQITLTDQESFQMAIPENTETAE